MTTKPNTVSELITAAADALTDVNPELLEDLRTHLASWLLTDEEKESLDAMLVSMIDAAELLDWHAIPCVGSPPAATFRPRAGDGSQY
jgi:hypothetical protein